MMNGLVVKRGELYLARRRTKSAGYDAEGNCWSRESQAARVFQDSDAAYRAARKVGGVVRILRDGRVEE